MGPNTLISIRGWVRKTERDLTATADRSAHRAQTWPETLGKPARLSVWQATQIWEYYQSSNLKAGADGAVIHCSEVVKAFLKECPGRIHLERLPAYSRATVAQNSIQSSWSGTS